jgi:hypothetical protein
MLKLDDTSMDPIIMKIRTCYLQHSCRPFKTRDRYRNDAVDPLTISTNYIH